MLIETLNPILRGWGNYYRHVVSSKTFSNIDKQIFESLYRWAKRRHPNKSTAWIVNKYYHMGHARKWRFQGMAKRRDGTRKYYQLFHLSEIPIVRHIKVKGAANPYGPEYQSYFRKRGDKKA